MTAPITDLEYRLKEHKKKSISIARELGYSRYVTQRIREAKSEIQVDQIMHSARMGE